MVTIFSCSNIFNDMYRRVIPVYLEIFGQHECLLRQNVSGVEEIEKIRNLSLKANKAETQKVSNVRAMLDSMEG